MEEVDLEVSGTENLNEGRIEGTPNEPIYARHAKLKSILAPRRQRRGRPRHDEGSSNGLEDFAVEVLFDSFLALYDSWEKRPGKGSYEQFFVSKYAKNAELIRKSAVGIEDFEITKVVGRGRFAEVVVARENGTSRVYAVKMFRKSDPVVQTNIAGIDNELQILANTKSPFLVPLKYSFHDAEYLHFAMEYMPGGDLQALLARCNARLPEDHLRFYLAELLLAINAVHSLGFAHRDIKPENILFDRYGHLKLADFGSSARLDSKGKALGKILVDTDPAYVAPEILESLEDDDENVRTSTYGIECDFWSFGVLAFTCCYGFNPFKGESGLETFRNVVSYKNSFNIPSGQCASSEFQMMIKQLVTSSSERGGYQQLLRHAFFNTVIWDGINHEVPPYIPNVTSDDDCSNFSPVSRSAFSGATKDAGSPLSFVGFTRTLPEACPLLNVSLNSTANSSCNSIETSFVVDERISVSQFRAELAAKEEAVAHKNAEILNLENRIEQYESDMEEKNLKIAKLAADVKRLNKEKEQLAKEMQDEREYRKELEDRSQDLVSDIRTSQITKLAEIETEMNAQKEMIAVRDERLEEVQQVVKKLRAENIRLASHLESEQSNSKMKENNAKANRSYRGSISIMESRLETNTMELEARIQEQGRKHEQALQNLLAKHDEKVQSYQEAIDRYKTELDEYIGRLEESRNSRDALLKEHNQLCHDHLDMKQHLESYINELEGHIKKLQDEREDKINEAKCELQRTRHDRDRLSIRIGTLETEASKMENKIRELSNLNDLLEESLSQFDKQRQETKELLAKTEECGRQEGAVAVLQEQLLKFQTAAESSRESFFEEKQKTKELEKKLEDLEKELTKVKLDLKFSKKDQKDAMAAFEKLKAEKEEIEKELKGSEQLKISQEVELRNAQQELERIKLNLQNSELNAMEKSRLLAEFKNDLEVRTGKFNKLNQELLQCQSKLEQFETIRLQFEEREKSCQAKDDELDEKDRKISSLENAVDTFKQVICEQEDQLKDLDKIIANNNDQTSEFIRKKASLEMEKAALLDDLKAARAKINELRSIQAFEEHQLKSTTAALKAEESRREEEVRGLSEKLRDLKESNEELAFRLAELEGNLEEVTVLKSTTATALESLKRENQFLREENCRNMTQIIRMKERSLELQNALEEGLSKAEAFKSRWESVSEEKMMLESDKMEVDAKLQAEFSHRVKLVEYLRDKCSASAAGAKKKKIFPAMIFGRDKSEPLEQDLLNMILSTPPPFASSTSNIMTPLSQRIISTSTPIPSHHDTGSSPIAAPTSTPRAISKTKLHPILEEALAEEQHLIQERDSKTKELNTLLTQQSSSDEDKENDVMIQGPPEPSFKRQLIFEDLKERPEDRNFVGAIHCVKELGKDLYLIGTETGLFSRKVTERVDSCVKIEGVGRVEQFEFLYQENLVILIEGECKALRSIPYGMLEACAKAAACSKPEVGFGQENLANLKDVDKFLVQKKKNGDGHLIVVILEDFVAVLDWHKKGFVLKHKLETPEKVACALTGFHSALMACCGRVYQLFFEDFSLHEFMGENDEAVGYAMDQGSSNPIGILDVGRSNLARGETVYRPEYLICFTDFAVFVDSHGRRSRSECILWNKAPHAVEYRHPNLFVTHFNSIEVLQVDQHSFTKSHPAMSRRSAGKEVTNFPESLELPDVPNPRIVGAGRASPSVILVTDDKVKSTILDISVVDFADNSSIFSDLQQQSFNSLSSQATSKLSLESGEKSSKTSMSSLSSTGTGKVANVWKSQRSSVLLPVNQIIMSRPPVPPKPPRNNSKGRIENERKGVKVRFSPQD